MANKGKYKSVLNKSNHGVFTIEDDDDNVVEIVLNGTTEKNETVDATVPTIPVNSRVSLLGRLWTTLTFAWMKPLLTLGNTRALEQSDLYDLEYPDTSNGIFKIFRKYWNRQMQKEVAKAGSASLSLSFMQAFGFPFISAGFLKLIHDSCLFIGPLLLNALINLLSDPAASPSIGYLYVLGLFLSNLAMSICLRQYFWYDNNKGIFKMIFRA